MTGPGQSEGREEELRALLRRVRQVELRAKRSVNAHAQGAYHSRFKGRGMAFDESRAYVPGDDPRHVDWNVTARTGELHVKRFVEERELTLLLAIDVSASMTFGSRGQQKRQAAVEAAALLAFSALRNHDKVGLLLFSDRIERLIRPRKGRGHILRLLSEILSCRPEGRRSDHAGALEVASHLSRQRAIVVWITDLLDPEATAVTPGGGGLGPLEKPLKVLARRHDLMVLEVTDPLEAELPDVGLVRVEDAETGQHALVDTGDRRVRETFRARVEKEREVVRQRLTRLGVEQLVLTCGEDNATAVVRFLQRQKKKGVA